MKYDVRHDLGGYDWQQTLYVQDRSYLSCAFPQIKGDCARHDQDRAWRELCYILTKQKELRRPTLFPSTSKELITQLLLSCPYARLVAETKSRHGNYQAYIWVIEQ
jgi:hypothetical protein